MVYVTKERFNKLIKIAGSNRKALEELYDYYYPSIVRHINRTFYGKLDGRDIAQKFFVNLFTIAIPDTVGI